LRLTGTTVGAGKMHYRLGKIALATSGASERYHGLFRRHRDSFNIAADIGGN